MEKLLCSFEKYGYTLLPAALDDSTVRCLVNQLSSQLLDEGLDLSAPSTFPTGPKRRIFEVSPCSLSGNAAYETAWANLLLSAPLCEALDALLGESQWTLPVNTPDSPTRHFYAPCTAPEHPGGAAVEACAAREEPWQVGGPSGGSGCCPAPRACPFLPLAAAAA